MNNDRITDLVELKSLSEFDVFEFQGVPYQVCITPDSNTVDPDTGEAFYFSPHLLVKFLYNVLPF